VDYSLAPENPFPRPTEEVLFAYAWAITNPSKLGWTGEKIVMVGDSAGGNCMFFAWLSV
jgi:hormone-sensitive lipase